MKTKYYIAYGSNLNKRQMKKRCPDATPIGKFTLTSARLIFRGVADVEYAFNSVVPCGLWIISENDEKALDRYEGIDSGLYFKSEEIKLSVQGKKKSALIYLMNSEGIFPPSKGYVDTIREGYRDFGLDQKYLDDAIEHAFLQKEPDEHTVARRLKQQKRGERLVQMPVSLLYKKLDAALKA